MPRLHSWIEEPSHVGNAVYCQFCDLLFSGDKDGDICPCKCDEDNKNCPLHPFIEVDDWDPFAE